MKKGNTILEISKDTLDSFQIAKMLYQSQKKKKVTNDEYLQELLNDTILS